MIKIWPGLFLGFAVFLVHWEAQGAALSPPAEIIVTKDNDPLFFNELLTFRDYASPSIKFSKNKIFVALYNHDFILLYDFETKKVLSILNIRPHLVVSVCISSDNSKFAYFTSGGQVFIMPIPFPSSPLQLPTFKVSSDDFNGSGFSMTFSPDGKKLLIYKDPLSRRYANAVTYDLSSPSPNKINTLPGGTFWDGCLNDDGSIRPWGEVPVDRWKKHPDHIFSTAGEPGSAQLEPLESNGFKIQIFKS